jgi:hypothetical protein
VKWFASEAKDRDRDDELSEARLVSKYHPTAIGRDGDLNRRRGEAFLILRFEDLPRFALAFIPIELVNPDVCGADCSRKDVPGVGHPSNRAMIECGHSARLLLALSGLE